MAEVLSYCGEQVRAHDPDRFLLSLLAPAECREDLWALFALNHEIAKTREVVSETQLGLIRLQWWRERIGEIYDGSRVADHEILKALAAAIRRHDLPRENFETLIYAREFDLGDVLPSNLDGLLSYADYTATPLMKLAVQVAGHDPEYEPVQPVAVNYALAGLLRAVPVHARQRRCYLPEDLLQAEGVTLARLYDFLQPEDGLRKVVEAVAAQFVPAIRPQSRFLRAAHGLAGIYMKQLRGCGYGPFHPRMGIPPKFREIRVAWAAK